MQIYLFLKYFNFSKSEKGGVYFAYLFKFLHNGTNQKGVCVCILQMKEGAYYAYQSYLKYYAYCVYSTYSAFSAYYAYYKYRAYLAYYAYSAYYVYYAYQYMILCFYGVN